MKIYKLVIFNSSRSKAAFWDTPTSFDRIADVVERLQKQESGESPVMNRFFQRLSRMEITGIRFICDDVNLRMEAATFLAESDDGYTLYKALLPLVRQLGLTLVHPEQRWMIQYDRTVGRRIYPALLKNTFEAYDAHHGETVVEKSEIRRVVQIRMAELLQPLGFSIVDSTEFDVSFERATLDSHFGVTFKFAGRSNSQWFAVAFRVKLKPIMDYHSLVLCRECSNISKAESALCILLKSLRWHVEPNWQVEASDAMESCRNFEEADWMLDDFERLLIPVIKQCGTLRGIYNLYCDSDAASRCYENLNVQSTSTNRALQIAWQLGQVESERAAELARVRSRKEAPHPRMSLEDIEMEVRRIKKYLVPTGDKDYFPTHSNSSFASDASHRVSSK